ncbi:hypothetical protein EV363DRAFT_1187063 [Boletus edulis]|uniref:Uncharacterized protein n=1 Tax=Boletus edulis BED1 TaxID=1328754 RepID=A0AAD4BDQ5_BOLED|nr:hypothetical protein EV363DRAFT_1408385 [Boletus edulis]KAF8121163.1 hypothetical protein EV363DRAFT_1187063 [Boletus edulis]KAF8422150.1 hypothetical protein L210DRAFT_3654253 [Boletus edulis BED1]KAF8447168.1 hypothetical protein L210DRAFT_3641135 [Boletus edulis BED1]
MFKLFVQFLCATTFASAVVASNIIIISPQASSTVVAGSNVTVQLGDLRPDQTIGTAITVDITACASASECPGVSQGMGQILYSGPYTAEHHNDADDVYQNITVTIPLLPNGAAKLGVSHYPLSGGGGNGLPPLEYTDTILNVVASN